MTASPINIVRPHRPELGDELFDPRAGPSAVAATGHLTYRGGPLLTAVEVVVLYLGSWRTPDRRALAANLDLFFDTVLVGPLMAQMAEYDVPGKAIGPGRRLGSAFVPARLPKVVTDARIRAAVRKAIAAKAVPPPSDQTLYFVYLARGKTVSQGGEQSCSAFCGYHDQDAQDGFYYAVMPSPDCAGCLGGMPAFDALTATSTHELCEAITDPVPGQGWYDDAHGEIGDICAWRFRKLGALTVQLEWSNARGACI